jgi:hypothetical protein
MKTITLRDASGQWATLTTGLYSWTDAGDGYLFLITSIDAHDWTLHTTTGARFYCTPNSVAYLFDSDEERAWFAAGMAENLRLNRDAVHRINTK